MTVWSPICPFCGEPRDFIEKRDMDIWYRRIWTNFRKYGMSAIRRFSDTEETSES